MQDGIAIGNADISIVEESCADDVALQELADLHQISTCDKGVLYAQMHLMRLLMWVLVFLRLQILLFFLKADLAEIFHSKGSSDNA